MDAEATFLVSVQGGKGEVVMAVDKIKRSEVRFPLPVMCRSVGQTSHKTLPLSSQQ